MNYFSDYLGIEFGSYKIIIAIVCVIPIIVVKTINKLRAYRVCKVIKNVEIEKKKVISNRDFVQRKIDATDHKIEKVNDVVFEWLKEVEKFLQEVENVTLTAEFRELANDELLNKLKTLNAKCDFEPFSNPIPSLEHFSSGNFVCFEPIKETSDRLLEALRNGNFYKIGLYGKRGSGKTKLVKAVAEKAKYLRVFDAVLFITVSQNPNIKQIQDEIADMLNLNFDKNTEAGRGRKLYLALESTNRPILVILDDVWENLDLDDIGIPSNSNRCKILLTSHCKQQFALMNCQEEIPLNPLSTEEAWSLFKTHSGINDDESSSDLLNMACEVAIECQGLPRTIKDVGSSLRSKPIEEWKASLDSLRYSMTQYDIFLSFRGKDTRDSFTGFLYDGLCQQGFKTFMDDAGLKGGDEISTSLINAIEASKIAIIVFSKKFAHSPWCLDELVTILKCKKMKNQQILPIFYKIEPSDVRHQKNSYEKGMAKQARKFGDDFEKLKKWRSALFEVASLSGITYKTGYVVCFHIFLVL